MATHDDTLHGQVLHQGQDVLGRLAQDLIKLPLVSGAITRLFDARERAVRAQELAMSALSVPSTADVERLTRRLRSVSQRIEGLEDGIDSIVDKLDKRPAPDLDGRLAKLEATLDRIEAALGEPAADTPPTPASPAPDSPPAAAPPAPDHR